MIKFAVFTDLHYDFIPDGKDRIDTFLHEIKNKNLDFIMNLGDFCLPIPENKHLLHSLEQNGIPCHHALGNHDSDTFEKTQILEFLNLKKSYYAFAHSDTKFIVLDACFTEVNGNYTAYDRSDYKASNGNYPIIPKDQLTWLQKELNDNCNNYILFSHHSLENEFPNRGIYNRLEVQQLLTEVTKRGKKISCFNGHDHANSYKTINQVNYIGLNGMSYIWFGELCTLKPYSREMYNKYPLLNDIVLYDQGLFAVVTINDSNEIHIEGKKGAYKTISPSDLGLPNQWNGRELSSVVSSLHIK